MNIKELSHLLYATFQTSNNKRYLSPLAESHLRKFLKEILSKFSENKRNIPLTVATEAPLIMAWCYGVWYNATGIEGHIRERLAIVLSKTEPALPLDFWKRVILTELGQP
jgi:hypothetical protein